MTHHGETNPPLTRPVKVVYLMLALVCGVIGLAGLLLPVIPGLLFLVAALYLGGKVSVLVKAWSEARPMLRGLHARIRRMEQVSVGDRLKVLGLTMADLTVRAIDTALRLARSLLRRMLDRFR